jgi:hypothetical protein
MLHPICIQEFKKAHMPLMPQTHSGHELAARATIAAALIASRTIQLGPIDYLKPWTENQHLIDLGNATERIMQSIADKR